MKEIRLTQDKVALVDDEDLVALSVEKWYAVQHGRTFYAARNVKHKRGKWRLELLHRRVLARKLNRDLEKGEQCDHINGNGLDNRRANLRSVTNAQNGRNCHRRSANPSSQFLGVHLNKKSGKWRAKVRIDGKQITLGSHDSELEAALAREKFIAEHPELNARTNFPETSSDM
jgi:hypothetical protein